MRSGRGDGCQLEVTTVVHPGQGNRTEPVEGEGGPLDVPPLRGSGVRADSLEPQRGTEAADDLGGDQRAPQPLFQGSAGIRQGVLDHVPTGLDRWHSYGGVSFAGIPVAQFWVEFHLWETLLNERQYLGIVELGTLHGGFSLYLASQAEHRGMNRVRARNAERCSFRSDLPSAIAQKSIRRKQIRGISTPNARASSPHRRLMAHG